MWAGFKINGFIYGMFSKNNHVMENSQAGRFTLRDEGKTIAISKVLKVVE